MRTSLGILLTALAGIAVAEDEEPDTSLDAAKLEAAGVTIGEIVLDKHNVFDLSNPSENNWLYRLANKYLGVDRYEWRQPGQVRVRVLVEADHIAMH